MPFFSTIHSNYKLEHWGVLFAAQNLGFVLQNSKKKTNVPPGLPKSIHLVHLWEDLWITKPDIVKSRIYSLFGLSHRIYARLTKVVKITKPELLTFLRQNHLNEPANGKFKYGLLFENQLVAVAVFSASCPVHRGNEVYKSHQLIRFCNKNGVTIVGGLSKLIKHFIKEQSPEDIMTYADLDWSDGKGYLKIGFKRIGELPPQKFSINEALVRNYKEEKPVLNRMCENQGSAKYLLDLKNA